MQVLYAHFRLLKRHVAADNPQTFQQALLLMATLARLTPDSVLQNIMPVFTFMGSNVFHRDDTYSFTVVQKVGSLSIFHIDSGLTDPLDSG